MKRVNGKEYNDLSLYFRSDNEKEQNAYDFLCMLGRKKTSFIADLISNYLISNGITNVSDITPEYAKFLMHGTNIRNAPTTSSMSLPVELLIKMLGEQLNNSISKPVEITSAKELQPAKEPQKKKNTASPSFTRKKSSDESLIKKEVVKPRVNDIVDSDEDFPDTSEDDFTMDNNILSGLSAFGVINR